MSTVAEVKVAVEMLPPQERQELFRWLARRPDFHAQQLETLRRDIAAGLAQADRGELAPLDIEAVKREFRRRLTSEPK